MSENGTPRTLNLLLGLTLIGFGALFLAGQTIGADAWGFIWPFFIILPGLLLYAGAFLGERAAGWLAVPGSVLIFTGLILFYQVLTGHWQSWAYAWALVVPTSIGAGLAIQGLRSGEQRMQEVGWDLVKTGTILFLFAAVFFEIILNISGFGGNTLGKMAGPLALIVVGILLLVDKPRRKDGNPHPGAGEHIH